jgi:subtilase family serine protease
VLVVCVGVGATWEWQEPHREELLAELSRVWQNKEWKRVESMRNKDEDDVVEFMVHMEQCNHSELERLALEVSTPKSSRYGRYLTAEEAHELVRCEDHTQHVADLESVVRATAERVGSFASTKEIGNSVTVRTTARVVEQLLESKVQRFMNAAGEERLLLEDAAALGALHSRSGVDFVTGLTGSTTRGRKYSVQSVRTRTRSRGGGIPGESDQWLNFTNVVVSPRTIRTMYNVPNSLVASAQSTIQGVAAFDDFYVPSDLCSAHNMLATDEQWVQSPRITYKGPSFDANADEAESDLDTQYITAMGTHVCICAESRRCWKSLFILP